MKKIILLLTLLFFCGFYFLLRANLNSTVYDFNDFSEIIPDKSDLQDVLEIAPETTWNITGTGASCLIPLKDNEWLYIEFYGKELIVDSLERIAQGTNSTGDGTVSYSDPRNERTTHQTSVACYPIRRIGM